MALDDMYEIVHDFTRLGKNMINVYHVERANGAEVSGTISDAFQNSVLPELRLLQSDLIINNEIRIFNLGNSLDFGTFTLTGVTGLRTGPDSPSFISPAIRFPTRNRDVRSGHKRFAGMLESDYTIGVVIAATIALLADIGTAMIGNWLSSVDSHVICNYAIIKRVCETTDPVTGKCLVYRLPEIDSELVSYKPTQFIVNPEISSQVSRKTF